ncbi:hypothetical protein JAAARDRAFT_28533 [Jaapia argillacea MUCL 33604]|uniref:Vacuolar ATPase assembly integral membrane protein VMA21 n=1 Tax=Jaapia argillacea MUCL 33604 TaxID=933084 RepID=A0A067QFF0_9AGAM|nr:hypothetical protein JAAARDRAFT_28533 [Jaapia argillacea MUCL 33604]
MSQQVAPAKVTEQAVQGGILIKLIIFSLSLAIVPITSYFLSEKYLWNGNSTYAALTAVFAANIFLVGYVTVSLMEDRPPPPKVRPETRKER